MNDVKNSTKAPWWGALIGFGIAAILSYSFIFPEDVRHLRLSGATVGDWVRVAVAIIISMVCAWMGYIIGDAVSEPE